MKPDLSPVHTEFMDADMRHVFQSMNGEDLEGYQLGDGTALAMYLNHRKSTEFDFFRKGIVERSVLQIIPWLEDADFKRDEGLVDAEIRGENRTVALNFIDATLFCNVDLKRTPILSMNGIPIAHPVDILTGKISALSRRGAERDFVDVAAAHREIPNALEEAAGLYVASSLTREASMLDLAKTIANYPQPIESRKAYEWVREELESLAKAMLHRGGDLERGPVAHKQENGQRRFATHAKLKTN